MKSKLFNILIATAVYSFLFYEQKFGLNFLLFTLVIIGLLVYDKKERLKDKTWHWLAAASLLSGCFVFWHGTFIAFLANFLALTTLGIYSVFPGVSIVTSWFYGLISYFSSFEFIILDNVSGNPKVPSQPIEEPKKHKFPPYLWLLFVLFVIVISVIFIGLYRNSNPLFRDLTDRINLDFISFRWIVFTAFGFLLMYGFFKAKNIPELHTFETTRGCMLDEEKLENKPNKLLGISIPIEFEALGAIIILLILNILLLMLNILDISFFAGGLDLPDGITYSDYVHQGVGNLIFSVILVILISMAIFRGKMNFHKEKITIVRTLALFWLCQNLVMIAMTAFRNQIYIEEYALTYRRIGVYVWLWVIAFGVVTTIYKVWKKKNNFFLYRINGLSMLFVVLFLAAFNWDIIIINYNVKKSAEVDFKYLKNMNDNAIPILVQAVNDKIPDTLTAKNDIYTIFKDEWIDYLAYRKNEYMIKWETKSWKSWNIDDYNTAMELKGMKLDIPE